MNEEIKGRVFVYGANIDTDQIYPGRYLDLTDQSDVARHAMEGADPNFLKEFTAGDIIVAKTNFGCGSSREHAVITLKAVGVGAIVADSFGRIFYRNAINVGIPVLICPGISDAVEKGDVIAINIKSGLVINETTGQTIKAQPMSEYMLEIIESGGIKPLIRKQLAEKKATDHV